MVAYVLVVDDETMICSLITRWLQRWGYSTVTVHDADSAMATMVKNPASIVVVDLVMPGDHNGIWLIEQIRSRWPHVPVIVESGVNSEEAILQTRSLGAVDFLPKPFAREQLHQALLWAATFSGDLGSSAPVEQRYLSH